jgi:threonine dehydrogenase-like Zn-dependent dehydrogenase
VSYTVDTKSEHRMVHSSGRAESLRDEGAAGDTAVSFWATGPGRGELRHETLPRPADDEVLVRTAWTGVSRGTESLVMRGEVPESEYDRMRAPFQAGSFPFPVKYGYLNVGVVEQGPQTLLGSTVFTLYPHQSAFVVPADAVAVVPAAVPARRAVLAGAVETAVNVLWDARPALGDRVTVIGAGMIGCCIARLAAGIPGVEVTLVDVDDSKAPVARLLGVEFASPERAEPGSDIVIEASGTAAGLGRALELAATDGSVIVASWFGSRPVSLDLGADFHSRRLTLVSSQVGEVAAPQRDRRTRRQRLELALQLLADPVFDVLLNGSSTWTELPAVMRSLAEDSADGTIGHLCHTIDWSRS